jgi:outer membrane protein insertion porin family
MSHRRLIVIAMAGAVCGCAALAQTDAPPELDQPLAPDELPPVEEPLPQVRGTLEVELAGAAAFKDKQLREGIIRQIEAIEEYGLDEASAYDAAYFLELFYRKNGYSQATVRGDILGAWRLRLQVVEGPRAKLGEVIIKGNHAFDTPTLSKYLLGPTRERFPRIREVVDLPFVESDVVDGAELVERLYLAEGYLDVVIEPPVVTFNRDKTVAAVELRVQEGTQYRFGPIRFDGTVIFSREQLLAEIAEVTEDIFTPGRLSAAQRKLEDYYTQRGYFSANVVASGDPSEARTGEVAVAFLIEAGPLRRFDGVTVTGTKGVKPSFIEKRLLRLQGKVYNPELIDRQFRELIETGLFRDLRITPEAIEPDMVRLDVMVGEAKPKEFGFGVGYATYFGGMVEAEYTDLNLFGTGRPLRIALEFNQRGYGGEVVYRDPWLFDTDYRLDLRLYALQADLKGYSKQEIGFQPALARYLTEQWKVSIFALGKHVSLRDVLIEPESLVGRTRYSVVSLGITQELDYRNDIMLPTRGFIFSTTLDVAPNGMGDISFVRGMARLSIYFPVTPKSFFALGARGGIISPLSSQVIPIDERFFSGGATTVRSFSEFTLGPKDRAGYPLGGQAFTVFNVEYTFPIYGDLQGAVFCDAGNVVANASRFGVESMRYAVGAGLRYNLPIGAVRFDYGLNPSPAPGEAQGAFHFAIGVAF